ncbi:hypothetical protein BC830DRAFT_1222849 [Chytriomyces sp. MP71]|nr:hypothetical protein BC830DRAFT_1222849 [Chytriomyces sp. MP71]
MKNQWISEKAGESDEFPLKLGSESRKDLPMVTACFKTFAAFYLEQEKACKAMMFTDKAGGAGEGESQRGTIDCLNCKSWHIAFVRKLAQIASSFQDTANEIVPSFQNNSWMCSVQWRLFHETFGQDSEGLSRFTSSIGLAVTPHREDVVQLKTPVTIKENHKINEWLTLLEK